VKLEDMIDSMGWIPLKRYIQITGEKKSTLHMRRINGVWKEGVHIATPPGGGAYINFKAVAEWCAASARPVHDVPKLLAEQVRKELSEAGS
jgi:hypothetical protein